MYVVYSMPDCKFCLMAKNLLTMRGIAYDEIHLADAEARLEFLSKLNGWRSFPVIFAKDAQGQINRFVGGYDKLKNEIGA